MEKKIGSSFLWHRGLSSSVTTVLKSRFFCSLQTNVRETFTSPMTVYEKAVKHYSSIAFLFSEEVMMQS